MVVEVGAHPGRSPPLLLGLWFLHVQQPRQPRVRLAALHHITFNCTSLHPSRSFTRHILLPTGKCTALAGFDACIFKFRTLITRWRLTWIFEIRTHEFLSLFFFYLTHIAATLLCNCYLFNTYFCRDLILTFFNYLRTLSSFQICIVLTYTLDTPSNKLFYWSIENNPSTKRSLYQKLTYGKQNTS